MRNKKWSLILLLPLLLAACGKEKSQSVEQIRTPDPVIEKFSTPADGFYNNELGSPAFELLAQARKSIDIEIYQMWDPDFQAAIHAALDRGVKVRVVIDTETLGSNCKILEDPQQTEKEDCKALKALKSKIVQKGGAFVRFKKEELCGKQGVFCFQHGKLIIADSSVALVSSGNFNPTNLCNKRQNPSRCNRDFSMITRDSDVIPALNTIFENDLKAVRYDLNPILTPTVAAKLTVSPLSMPPLVRFIESAKREILVQNQYLKDRELNAALIAAAKRGVQVKVTVASACAFAPPDDKSKKEITDIYSEFDAAGISSRMFTKSIPVGGKPGYLHSKAIVVDGEHAWVGSVNGSTTAISVNREFGLFFHEAQEVGELHKIMIEDHHHRGAETWEESLRCAKDNG